MIRNTGAAFGGRPIGSVFLITLIDIYGYSLYMDDIWIISWFNHTAFDANPIWQSPMGPLGPGRESGLGPGMLSLRQRISAKVMQEQMR